MLLFLVLGFLLFSCRVLAFFLLFFLPFVVLFLLAIDLNFLHTRCSGALRIQHFEPDLLCKLDVEALQEYIAQAPDGIAA